MSLCATCDSIDLGSGGRYRSHPEKILGPVPELRTRATNGCPGCDFFYKILVSSVFWKSRLDELETRVVAFSSLRLDVRKATELNSSSWSCDDLLFDVCVDKDYENAPGMRVP